MNVLFSIEVAVLTNRLIFESEAVNNQDEKLCDTAADRAIKIALCSKN